MQFIILLALLSMATLGIGQRQFNSFKSYKDAKIKPPHYSKIIKRNHPMNEYLSESQLRMMKHRTSQRHHPDSTFKENWTGFDKNRRKLDGTLSPDDAFVEGSLNSAVLMWSSMMFVLGSLCWTVFLLLDRQRTEKKILECRSPGMSTSKYTRVVGADVV
mmetsp:Transcript_35627/g.70840  ORF Transcript_35627/g.70840 Transcript_35627/m.70840 type:complete len:160 (+) Transcript_35627:114-593(+)